MSTKDGILTHDQASPTAATVGNALFGESGPMLYRVQLVGGVGTLVCDVTARGGDDAAAQALAQHPGAKVAHVAPAPQKQAA